MTWTTWTTYRKSRRSSWSRSSRWSILPPLSPLTLETDGTLRWRWSAGAEEGGNWTCRSSLKTLLQSNTLQSPHVNLKVGIVRIHDVWSGVKVSHGLVASYISDGEPSHTIYADDVLLCPAPLGLPAGPSVLESPGCPRCHGSPGFPERPEAPAHRVRPAANVRMRREECQTAMELKGLALSRRAINAAHLSPTE